MISESLSGKLPSDLKFTHVIFENVSLAINEYFRVNKVVVDSQAYSKIIGGILLGYAILPSEKAYYSLSRDEKNQFLSKYLDIIVK